MPVKIFTLGQFRIEIDGEPLPFGKKAQRKPMTLLKVLIARGENSVHVEQLGESIWPEADGDQAYGSLTSALNRLRKIVGRQAVQLSDGRLGLNPRVCWTDTLELEKVLGKISGSIGGNNEPAAWEAMQEALGLYQGPFLEGEFEPAEILSAREKLHSLFVRQLVQLGQFLVEQGQVEKAITLYQKGLDADDLAEEFYLGLMRCLEGEGRLAEGIAIFQRCRQMLYAKMEVEPSAQMEAAHQQLLASQKKQPTPTASPAQASAPPGTAVQDAPQNLPRPSLAVLPFDSLGGDAEQENFADGIAEDLITDLSKFSGLLVMDRKSSFVYKSQAVDARQVGRELGVRYVLEGSVRRSEKKVRINVQLVAAETGEQIWADRYDRVLKDIFAIQDEITEEIVVALDIKLVEGLAQRGWRKFLKTKAARELYRATNVFFMNPSKAGNIEARPVYEQIIEAEPGSPVGHQGLAWSHWYDAKYGWSQIPDKSLKLADKLAQVALSKDSAHPATHMLVGNIHLLRGEFEQAIAAGERAENMEPTHSHVVAYLANILTYTGNPKEAVEKAERAIRLNPSQPAWYFTALAAAHYGCGEFEKAINAAEASVAQNREEMEARAIKIASQESLGRHTEAEAEALNLERINPAFSLSAYAKSQPYRDQAALDNLLELLRKSGLPE